MQIGSFRVGAVDGWHFSVSHFDGKTAEILGKLLGPLAPFPSSFFLGLKRILFRNYYFFRGFFRGHPRIFTADGHRHMGNGHRTDWTTFGRPLGDCQVLPETYWCLRESAGVKPFCSPYIIPL